VKNQLFFGIFFPVNDDCLVGKKERKTFQKKSIGSNQLGTGILLVSVK
jgi:hypothetical protein